MITLRGATHMKTSLLVWITLTGLAMGQTNVNWPQFHLNNSHTGFNAQETTLKPANVPHLELQWTGILHGTVIFHRRPWSMA
jgi:hypothetical protein